MTRERAQLHKIARLYYLEDMNQRSIADRLNMSMASVSRGLAKAKESGIVQISIVEDPDSFHDMELEIERAFGLKECIITPTYERIENTYRAFAEALADLLRRIAPKGSLVGVSWGETLKALSEHMQGVAALRCDVVPTIGAMGTIETGIYPNSIARSFAGHLGGRSYLVNAPAVVDDAETRRRIMGDSTFEPIGELWERVEVAILGASSLEDDTSVRRGGIIPDAELASLRDAGAAAASNFVFLSEDGSITSHPMTDRILAMSEQQLRGVPHTVVIAGGGGKSEALRATMNSGLAGVVITDAETASRIRAEQ